MLGAVHLGDIVAIFKQNSPTRRRLQRHTARKYGRGQHAFLDARGHDGQWGRLFEPLWPLTLAESHTPTAAGLVNEFDAKL